MLDNQHFICLFRLILNLSIFFEKNKNNVNLATFYAKMVSQYQVVKIMRTFCHVNLCVVFYVLYSTFYVSINDKDENKTKNTQYCMSHR